MPADRICVALTGHRLDRLRPERVAPVAAAITAVLEQIERAVQPLPPDALRLVTGLADGADAIGADCALERGWRLDVILPFVAEDYARDFAPGVRREQFERQRVAAASVMELPGDRTIAEGEGVAYERAGRITLAQSDILIGVWDGGPARGRGGAPQIIAEAVLQGIPVVHIDPRWDRPPMLLWDGPEERDLGQESLDTVARRDLGALAGIVADLLVAPDETSRTTLARFAARRRTWWTLATAWPMLLALTGVRRPRLSDLRNAPAAPDAMLPCASDGSFTRRIRDMLAPRFTSADMAARRYAQLFRSVYVSNFTLAAAAVVLSMFGLVVSKEWKPALLVLELVAIGTILVQTHTGNRAAWHRLWLDNRALAERLRCLAISSQLGDLLRIGPHHAAPWVVSCVRATAQEIGLPSARVDDTYLRCVRADLTGLVDDQIAYFAADARRMHKLEHRLHMIGTILFALTAATCASLLLFKTGGSMLPGLKPISDTMSTASTIVGGALPAMGAAIYGIRMQGDFAGTAERSHALHEQLTRLRAVLDDDELSFDTLSRRVKRVTGLLTEDLAAWLQTYHARPLALPG